MQKIIQRITLMLMVIVLAGCAGVNVLSWGKEIAAKPGDALLEDDFSDPASGFALRVEEGENLIGYNEGRFRFWLNTLHHSFWSTAGKTYRDVTILTEGYRLGGPENNAYGVMCRYQEGKGYYGFLIASDRYYAIVKMKDGQVSTLSSPGMEVNPAILGGFEVNRVRADCIGPLLRLWVNNEMLVQAADTDFTYGDVGLLVQVFDEEGVDVAFDNYLVIKAEAP